MEHFLIRLARHAARGRSATAAAAASAARSYPDTQPIPTPSVQYLAAAAAADVERAAVDDGTNGASVGGGAGDWELPGLNSNFTENFTLFTDGPSGDSTLTPGGHILTAEEAWPVSSFAVIKALVLVIILAILLIVSCKVTMQYLIRSSKREKR